jgi:hypothetical protein
VLAELDLADVGLEIAVVEPDGHGWPWSAGRPPNLGTVLEV